VRAAAALRAATAVRAAESAIVGAIVSIRVGVGVVGVRAGANVLVERRVVKGGMEMVVMTTAIKVLLIRSSPWSLPLLTITSNFMLHPSPVQTLNCNNTKHTAFRFQIMLLSLSIQIWMRRGFYFR
jgi:hypothetical protein